MEPVTIPLLRQAIETRDGQTLAGFYADNATLSIIDQESPPSRPREIQGRDAIAAYFDDVCGRTMTHRVDMAVSDGEQLAFTQVCTYPDGNRVFCASNARLAGGKIARQVCVQAWDP